MDIRGFLENSLIDYPGKISCVIFTHGCNLRCDWCHSPSLVSKSKLFLKKYKEYEIINFIKEKNKYQKWIDSIVICGGEPTIQKDLVQFLIKIRLELPEILIKLDTNGTNPSQLKRIIHYKLVDYIAMDIKPLQLGRDKYMESIDIVKNSKIQYEFRMTCVPTEVTNENIEQILKPFYDAERLILQNFNNKNDMINKKMKNIVPYKSVTLKKWMESFKDKFNEISIR